MRQPLGREYNTGEEGGWASGCKLGGVGSVEGRGRATKRDM